MPRPLLRLMYELVRVTRPRRREGGRAKTVLVLQYQMPLGCCVHGTPIFAALKAALREPTVVVATRGLGKATLEHDPHVDALIETGDPMASMGALWRTAEEIRRQLQERGLRPDLVLQDASNRRGKFALFALMLRLAPTAGFAEFPELYDLPFAYDAERSLIDNNLRLAKLVDAPVEHREPAVYFTEAELAYVRGLLRAANPEGRPVTAFVVQGSGGQRTGWHDERFAEVIRYVEAMGHATVFPGTAADEAVIERIRGVAAARGVSLAGKTSVPQLAALLCVCDLLITLDTGTMHVGRASQIPMVVLGPSWQRPLEWLPLGRPQARVLRGEDKESVPPEYKLDEIQAGEVIEAVEELLRVYPPSEGARAARVAARLSTTRG